MNQPYLSSKEMYEVDRYTIQEIGIPSPVLMERAAYSVFLHLKAPLQFNDQIVVVAGTGNNGGDAVAVARMLYLAGYLVTLYLPKSDGFSEEMQLQVDIAKNVNVPLTYTFDDQLFKTADYIVEGLFGIGLSREIEGIFQKVIQLINEASQATTIVAIDIPSGLSASRGSAFDVAIKADQTYTFGFFKKGMETKKGQELCGELILCDIGYPIQQIKHHLNH